MISLTAADVPAFLRGAWSDADLNAALAWASGEVEAYCERDFTYRNLDVVLVDPFPVNRSAQLPNPPVTLVSQVEGFLRTETGVMDWQPLTNWAWTADGLLYDTTGQPGTDVSALPSWPSAPKSLRVTYSHGFATIPADLKAAVVKAAGNYLANPYNMVQRTVGEVTYRWNDQTGQHLLDDVLLGKYRLVSVQR